MRTLPTSGQSPAPAAATAETPDPFGFAFTPLDPMSAEDRLQLAQGLCILLNSPQHRPHDLLRQRGLVTYWTAIRDIARLDTINGSNDEEAKDSADEDCADGASVIALRYHLRRVAVAAVISLAAKTFDELLALDAILLNRDHHSAGLH